MLRQLLLVPLYTYTLKHEFPMKMKSEQHDAEVGIPWMNHTFTWVSLWRNKKVYAVLISSQAHAGQEVMYQPGLFCTSMLMSCKTRKNHTRFTRTHLHSGKHWRMACVSPWYLSVLLSTHNSAECCSQMLVWPDCCCYEYLWTSHSQMSAWVSVYEPENLLFAA